MKILKQENWWIWLLLFFFSGGTSTIVLGALLDVYDKNAWYAKWYYWVLGFVCFIFPFYIMMTVFMITITTKVSAKLDVPGSELYLSPYVWILCLIIPFIGWTLLFIIYLYITIWNIVMLYRGSGEKYIT